MTIDDDQAQMESANFCIFCSEIQCCQIENVQVSYQKLKLSYLKENYHTRVKHTQYSYLFSNKFCKLTQ